MLDRAWPWAAAATLLLLGGSLLLAGCGRGAHADQPKKLKAPELPLVKAEVLIAERVPWPATENTSVRIKVSRIVSRIS